MFTSTAISIVLSLIIIATGVTVLTRNTKKTANRLFFLVCASSAVWASSFMNIELVRSLDLAIFLNKLSYSLAVMLLFSVYWFTLHFPKERSRKYLMIGAVITAVLAVASVTDFVSGTVSGSYEQGYEFTYGIGTIVYSIVFAAGLGASVWNLLSGYKKEKSKEIKQQTKMMVAGLGGSLIVGLFLSSVVPLLAPDSQVDDFTPFAVMIFFFFAGYSIIRHSMFEIRSVFARAIVYLLSSAFIAIIYVTIAFFAQRFVFEEIALTPKQLTYNIVSGLLIIVTYPYVKRKFDSVTNSIFYRDKYDAQNLIDTLNQALVTNVDFEPLLTKGALIMQENFKSSTAGFFIRSTSYFDRRVIGSYRNEISSADLEKIEELSSTLDHKVHSTELDTNDDVEAELNKLLKSNDIEVMVRLVDTLDYKVKGVGYVFLGPKRSGGIYTAEDMKVLEIIGNELVIAVENVLRFEEIEQFNVTLQKKIDDATKELKQSNDKLKALDEAKDEFVSMASHQLRTPLTSVKGYISMVLEGDAGKITETQEKMLGQAYFSSQRMVYLISDLLNVSRLKTGKFNIQAAPLQLEDVISSELDQLYDGAKAKDITLSFKKPKEFPKLLLDEMKIRQVIMNFVDNAIYYTKSGGKITVDLKQAGKSIEFSVKDTGIGVPAKQQHKLFTKFYRADNARKSRPDGTGLGLFMAKKVIVAQGGSIIFDSKENKGSTFGFSFPKDKVLFTEQKDTKKDEK